FYDILSCATQGRRHVWVYPVIELFMRSICCICLNFFIAHLWGWCFFAHFVFLFCFANLASSYHVNAYLSISLTPHHPSHSLHRHPQSKPVPYFATAVAK